MTPHSFPQYAVSLCILAGLLGGCSGSRGDPVTFSPSVAAPRPEIQQPSVSPSQTALTAAQQSGASWVAPEAASEDLLYATDVYTVTVYSYPQGKLEGVLKGFYSPIGECVDKAGDIWIVDLGHGRVVEYAHGGKRPVAVLNVSGFGCAVDPMTGDLAVTSGDTLAVFRQGRGEPVNYSDPDVAQFWYCGYNDKGDLFADGRNSQSNHFELAELPRDGTMLKTIKVTQVIDWPGGVQWDGKHMAIEDSGSPVIYQFAVNGRHAVKVGATPLGPPAQFIYQFFIDGKTIVVPNHNDMGKKPLPSVLFYNYPAGGTVVKKITKDLNDSHGAVVSRASI